MPSPLNQSGLFNPSNVVGGRSIFLAGMIACCCRLWLAIIRSSVGFETGFFPPNVQMRMNWNLGAPLNFPDLVVDYFSCLASWRDLKGRQNLGFDGTLDATREMQSHLTTYTMSNCKPPISRARIPEMWIYSSPTKFVLTAEATFGRV